MENNYSVHLENRQIGTVSLQKKGLYYVLSCKCKLAGDKVYRLHMQCGDHISKIGIPVPDGDAFTLRVNIPAGKIPDDHVRFFVLPAEERADKQWIPVIDDSPFPHIDCLEHAVFAQCNGRPCVSFTR